MASDQNRTHVLRNREHQRQSRARRKGYISELECRLHRYEVEGVNATAAVQAAARRVVEENRGLRALLNQHGISTADFDARLAGAKEIAPTAPPSSTCTQSALVTHSIRASLSDQLLAHVAPRPPPATSKEMKRYPATIKKARKTEKVSEARKSSKRTHRDESCDLPATRARLVNPNPLATHQKLRPNNDLQRQELEYPLTPDSHTHVPEDGARMLSNDGSFDVPPEIANGRRGTSSSSGYSSRTYSSTAKASPDEIDCEYAAQIIANMRGHNDHESLRPELGCSIDRKCMIKNVNVLQMA